jgi:hypothetical protein
MACSSLLTRPHRAQRRYPFDKRANVRHLTDDNGFVFQSSKREGRTSLLRPAGNGGFFYARYMALPDVFRGVKAIAQTPPFDLPGV